MRWSWFCLLFVYSVGFVAIDSVYSVVSVVSVDFVDSVDSVLFYVDWNAMMSAKCVE